MITSPLSMRIGGSLPGVTKQLPSVHTWLGQTFRPHGGPPAALAAQLEEFRDQYAGMRVRARLEIEGTPAALDARRVCSG